MGTPVYSYGPGLPYHSPGILPTLTWKEDATRLSKEQERQKGFHMMKRKVVFS